MSRRLFVLPTVGANDRVRVDTASDTDTPAALVTDGPQTPIPGGLLTADSRGMLPRVWGPSGTSTLYVKILDYQGSVTGSPVTVTGSSVDGSGGSAVLATGDPQAGDTLTYDPTTGLWHPVAGGGSGGTLGVCRHALSPPASVLTAGTAYALTVDPTSQIGDASLLEFNPDDASQFRPLVDGVYLVTVRLGGLTDGAVSGTRPTAYVFATGLLLGGHVHLIGPDTGGDMQSFTSTEPMMRWGDPDHTIPNWYSVSMSAEADWWPNYSLLTVVRLA